MIELKDIQEKYRKAALDGKKAGIDLQRSKAAMDKLAAAQGSRLKGLNKEARKKQKIADNNDRIRLNEEIKNSASTKKQIKDGFDQLATGFFTQLDPTTMVQQLNDSIPLLMFPLRLETRFKSTGDQKQLWLRVYPDDCNINTKEELLSQSEYNDARAFWIEMWKAGGIETEERGAWRSLVNSHGSGRSAWIIDQYKPAANNPVKTDETFKVLVVTSAFAVTDAEHNAAKNYWVDVWVSEGDAAAEATAFNTLKTVIGNDARAGEIKLNYVPENIDDEVPEEITRSKVLLEKLTLPAYTPKETSWTQAAKTMALPDKFVAITINGGAKKPIVFTYPVKEELAVSPDPSLPEEEQISKDTNNNLVLNQDMLWMVDFDKAVESGMAVKIDLSPQEAIRGFEKLFVVGIRFKSDKDGSKTEFENLISNHFYSSNGFGLLRQGTPTNNTEDEPSGYTWIDDADESYERIFLHREDYTVVPDLDKKSDGQKLADCLGIDSAILKLLPNANGKDQLEACAMNTALFPATLGYFMQEMMDPLFSEKEIDATRTFFSNFVSGRGPIPAIRIGKQPYGILPTSVYSKLDLSSSSLGTKKTPYLEKLYNLLMKMDATWDSLVPEVSYIGKSEDPHQVLLDVVGLHPNSVEFYQRYSQTIQDLYNRLRFIPGPAAADIVREIVEKGRSILNSLGINIKDAKIPILEKYFLSEPNPLTGPLVDILLSEIYSIGETTGDINYIEWLATATVEEIRTEDFDGATAPTAMLYLLLRHALMLAQADAASALLVTNAVVGSKRSFYDPAFINVEKNNPGKSKFEHLYSTYPAITGSAKLAEHIYKTPVLTGAAETKRLNETINALNVLKDTSTAALERLFIEHLDCCNYRIDAWKTGLINYMLTEKRTGSDYAKTGIYLGAYGWLLDVKPDNRVLASVDLSGDLDKIFNTGNDGPLQTDSANLGYIHAPSLHQAETAAILRNAYDRNRDAGTGNPFAIDLSSSRVRIADSILEGMRNGQSLAALLGYQFERGLHDKYSLGQGEVDMFIYPLRKQFPLVADNLADVPSDPTDPIQAIEANNVIDGVKLINYVQDAAVKTYPFGFDNTILPDADPDQAAAINAEVTRIIDIHDAISDLVISEQLYQVVQGNFERASGNAVAFSKGSYPPNTDIMNTPRSGITLSHRMAIQFNAGADPGTSPNSVAMTAKAKAEPSVNEWLSANLPAPKDVLCWVTYISPIKTDTIPVSQEDLGLQSIDLLYIFNIDADQAMTELDDRIVNFIRYNKSKHPKTDVTINYTKIIDEADKTKISFFELAALIKSLRSFLIRPSTPTFLDPGKLTVPKDAETPEYLLEDGQLRTRVITLNNDLITAKSPLDPIIANTKSIGASTATLKTQLEANTTDNASIEFILTQLTEDSKAYLVALASAEADTLAEMVAAFTNNISFITDAAVKAALVTFYSNLIVSYKADFSNFDDLVLATTTTFLNLAFFNNDQTGTGFIHQGISGVYQTAFEKLDTLIERWEKKKTDYEGLTAGYAALGSEEEKFDLIKKAERLISVTSTFSSYTIADNYKDDVDDIKVDFDDLLRRIKDLKTNAKQKVTAFIVDAEIVLAEISTYDVIAFDTTNGSNSLVAEKKSLALLKEDIVTAVNNLHAAAIGKTAACDTLRLAADATLVNSEKITNLLNAAKTLLGNEALLLPQYKLNDPQATEIENSYSSKDTILDFVKDKEGSILPVEDWMAGVARTREKVHEWENACFLFNAFKPGNLIDVSPLQFPYKEEDRWLAMRFRDKAEETADPAKIFTVESDTLLYTAHFAVPFDKSKAQCGIVIDSWPENIPADNETTGITFHYDQPNSEPPQTMLLVTSPQTTGEWKWEDIINAMEETLDLAKKRAVEPSQIERTGYSQFLPSTMAAVTRYWITMGLNYSINNVIELNVNDN